MVRLGLLCIDQARPSRSDGEGSRDAGRALPAFLLQPRSTFVLVWSPYSPPPQGWQPNWELRKKQIGRKENGCRGFRKKNKKETINLWEPVRTRAQLYYLKDLNKKKKKPQQLKNFYCFPFFLKKNQTKKKHKKKKKIKRRRWRNKNGAGETEEGLEEPIGITLGD